MEESSLDPQHSPGRTDFNFDFSIDKIRCDVDNTNVSNFVGKNDNVIFTIEPYLNFWPNNDDPWGKTLPRHRWLDLVVNLSYILTLN